MTRWTDPRRWLLPLALAALAACGTTAIDDDATGSAEKLYADAKDDMSGGGWDRAIKKLEKVEGRAAGTLLSQQALLETAYAQWKLGETASAIASLDRFVKLYPSSPAFDYALYLKGTVNFNDNTGFLSALSRQDFAERDQQASRDAYQAYAQLVELYPASKYAGDARQRMDFIVNALANHEIYAARYYFRRGAYVAAVNRASQVLREYPRSPAAEEALYIMATSYEQLGLDPLRDDADRVLKLNFPQSAFLRDGIRRPDKPWWQLW